MSITLLRVGTDLLNDVLTAGIQFKRLKIMRAAILFYLPRATF